MGRTEGKNNELDAWGKDLYGRSCPFAEFKSQIKSVRKTILCVSVFQSCVTNTRN